MRLLPKLLWSAGAVALPVSDRAAGGLVAALLSRDKQARQYQFAATIAHEPTLALWTLCRFTSLNHLPTGSVWGLAGWLSEAQAADWFDGGRVHFPLGILPEDQIAAWRLRSAVALEVAASAQQFAQQSQVDSDWTYLLALLHRAPEWLAAAACDGAAIEPAALLPDWLLGALAALDSAAAAQPTSSACVAAALRLHQERQATSGPGSASGSDAIARPIPPVDMGQSRASEPVGGEQFEALLCQLARLEALEGEFAQTLETEKLAAMKELAYGASHEINNPLANISARAQTLLEEERDPERRRKLAAINSQALRAHEMIADMMLFARPPQPRLATVELTALVAGQVAELASGAAAQATQLIFQAPGEAIRVTADRTQLAVAVRALCVNALEALASGGCVELAVHRQTAPMTQSEKLHNVRETVQITVSDSGPGIPPAARRHLFDPFFSGREAGRGLGLGLSKCWRIVTAHGGRIDVGSSPAGGARFTITLPVEPPL